VRGLFQGTWRDPFEPSDLELLPAPVSRFLLLPYFSLSVSFPLFSFP